MCSDKRKTYTMEYYSCEWIEYRLLLDHWQLKFCCIPHSKGKGFVPICSFSGGKLPVDIIVSEREKLRQINNDERYMDSPCKGCHRLRKDKWEKLEGNVLFNQIEISNFTLCNLKCDYCYTVLRKEWNLPAYAYPLSPIFEDIIRNGYLHESGRIEWAGGEPTILKDFGELEKMLLNKGFFQTVFTNSVVFSEDLEQGLRQKKISIVTSIDAGTPETYRKIKGKDCFDTVWANAGRYARTGGYVAVKYIVKHNNSDLKDIHGFLNLCKSHNISTATIVPDNNEISKDSISDETLYAVAVMSRESAKLGIDLNIQKDYFGEKYFRRISDYMKIEGILKIRFNRRLSETVKISVVIPCCNHGEFLKEAVQSVMFSAFDNYEIIVVNDGSADAFTLRIFDELEKDFSENQHIVIVHQENAGVSAARNNAIRLSRGEYILPLDADDKIRPNYLSRAAEILDKHPDIGVIYPYVQLFGEKQNVCEFPPFDAKRLLLYNFIVACSVFRKNLWNDCGGYDPEMRLGYEDWEFWIRVMKKGRNFHLIREVMADCRFRSGSRNSACDIPENRRELMRYICNKHKEIYSENLTYIISEKDADLLQAILHARNLEAAIKEKNEILSRIYNSHGWKALLMYYRILDKVFPINTGRRRAARNILKLFR